MGVVDSLTTQPLLKFTQPFSDLPFTILLNNPLKVRPKLRLWSINGVPFFSTMENNDRVEISGRCPIITIATTQQDLRQ